MSITTPTPAFGIVVPALTMNIRHCGNDATGDGSEAFPVASSEGALRYLESRYPNCHFLSVTFKYGEGSYSPPFFDSRFSAETVGFTGMGHDVTTLLVSEEYILAKTGRQYYCSNFTWELERSGILLRVMYSNVHMTNMGIRLNGEGSSYGLSAADNGQIQVQGDLVVECMGTVEGIFYAERGGIISVYSRQVDLSGLQPAVRNRAIFSHTAGRIHVVPVTEPVIRFGTDHIVDIGAYNTGVIAGPIADWIKAYVSPRGLILKDSYSTIYGS